MSEERLLARIEKLEQSNRRMKGLGGAAVAVALLLGATSAATAMCDTVWAERFVLKDNTGKKRIMLDAYHTQPNISFFDAKGKKKIATIALNENGAPNWTCQGGASHEHKESKAGSTLGN